MRSYIIYVLYYFRWVFNKIVSDYDTIYQQEDWGTVGPRWHHGSIIALRGPSGVRLQDAQAGVSERLRHIPAPHHNCPPISTTSTSTPNPMPAHGQRPQAERVKRSILSFTGQTLEQEEFDHFRPGTSLSCTRIGWSELRMGRCYSASALLWTCQGLSSAATATRNSSCWPLHMLRYKADTPSQSKQTVQDSGQILVWHLVGLVTWFNIEGERKDL